MTRRDFIKALEEYYGKEFEQSKLIVFKRFLDDQQIGDERLEDLFYAVVSQHTNNSLPPLSFFVKIWEMMRPRKYSANVEEILKKNERTIQLWWSYPIEKIFGIIKYIEAKNGELDGSDREFINQFSALFYETQLMRSIGWTGQRMRERLEYVLGKLKNGETYTELERKNSPEIYGA